MYNKIVSRSLYRSWDIEGQKFDIYISDGVYTPNTYLVDWPSEARFDRAFPSLGAAAIAVLDYLSGVDYDAV